MDSLQAAIDKARSCGVTESDPSLARALHFLSVLQQVDSADRALQQSVDEARDLEGLQRAVQRAEEVMEAVRGEARLEAVGVEVQVRTRHSCLCRCD